MADELSVHVNKHDALASVMLIYKKSMLHPRAHPQAVLEALQDVTAAVARHDEQWRSHDLLALLKATDMGKVVNGLRKYPSRRVAALAKQVFHAWKLTCSRNNVLGSTLEYTSLAPPPADHDPDCPPSPHVYVIVDDDDDAADDVLVTPSSVAASKILKQVAASATSPSPRICQSALAKSTQASSDDITSHSHVACRAVPAPADAPVVARKRSFNDANITCSTASYQAKLEASRRKLHAGYEREQAAKRLHTICLVRPDQLPQEPTSKSPAAGTHAISTSRRSLHDHVRKASSIAVPAPQGPIKSWHGAAVVRAH